MTSGAYAEAYAAWTGDAIATEAEGEYAARGELDGAEFAWCGALEPDAAVITNYWRVIFSFETLKPNADLRTSAVGAMRQAATACPT